MTRFVARLMIVLVPLLGLVWAAEVQRTTAAGPGAPILLVTNTGAANPYGPYLGEILRAEGLNAFNSAQLSSLDAATLSAAQLVVLAETTLTGEQVTLFTTYVNGGGRLIAMRPAASTGVAV